MWVLGKRSMVGGGSGRKEYQWEACLPSSAVPQAAVLERYWVPCAPPDVSAWLARPWPQSAGHLDLAF
jgi:predicted phosphoadenosine phosphosulfate sulfurtransferase